MKFDQCSFTDNNAAVKIALEIWWRSYQNLPPKIIIDFIKFSMKERCAVTKTFRIWNCSFEFVNVLKYLEII